MGRSVKSILAEHGVALTEEELEHSGVKGMRWGRRKKRDSSDSDSGPSKPSIKDMSDDDLKKAIARLKMEKEFTTLTAPQVSAGRKIVANLLLEVGKQQAKDYLNREITKLIVGGGVKGAVKLATKGAATNAAPAVARTVMQLNKNHGL